MGSLSVIPFIGILGILFLIPFRKYFVSEMHGKYPFPEATATTQVLISGEKSGNQAKPLIFQRLTLVQCPLRFPLMPGL